jgi:hypothetical protein
MVQEGLHLEINNGLAEVAHVTGAIQQFSHESICLMM